jgi:hypothetical protein
MTLGAARAGFRFYRYDLPWKRVLFIGVRLDKDSPSRDGPDRQGPQASRQEEYLG